MNLVKASRAAQRRSAADIVNDLLDAQRGRGFTLAQLKGAVAKLLAIAPDADVTCLRLTQTGYTSLALNECPHEQAAALVGRENVPLPPARRKYSSDGEVEVRRGRHLRMHICAQIDEEVRPICDSLADGSALRQFAPDAIRALAPEQGPATASAALWLPERDIAAKEDAIARLNSLFRLREGDVQRLVALYARLKAEAVSAVLAALDEASLVDARHPNGRPALSVVVDNSPGNTQVLT
jgi:hypothetical protein